MSYGTLNLRQRPALQRWCQGHIITDYGCDQQLSHRTHTYQEPKCST